MGIFSKSNKGKSLYALFPDGREVKTEEELNDLRSNYSYSPSTISKHVIHPIDFNAYGYAELKLKSLGFDRNESIIAFGPIKIFEYPENYNEYIANGILTSKSLIIYYYSVSPIHPEYLIVELSQIKGITSYGGWTSAFSFNTGVHIKKQKTYNVKSPYFVLSEILAKDGHENRRSITFIDSLAKTLDEFNKLFQSESVFIFIMDKFSQAISETEKRKNISINESWDIFINSVGFLVNSRFISESAAVKINGDSDFRQDRKLTIDLEKIRNSSESIERFLKDNKRNLEIYLSSKNLEVSSELTPQFIAEKLKTIAGYSYPNFGRGRYDEAFLEILGRFIQTLIISTQENSNYIKTYVRVTGYEFALRWLSEWNHA